MTNYDHLCLGCMGDKGAESVCPHCGWVVGSPAEAPQHLPPGTILHDKYLLGRVLGHGGFGITYLAWDLNLDMKLAIKEYMPRDFATRAPEQTMVSVFTGGLDAHFENGLKKFLDEAKTLAQFNNHPGVVAVRDFFRENGTAYLVMYYLEGIDFKQYLESQGGKIPFQTALSIMMPVMDALREVHRTGTLHRDISPDNIYITAEGQVKVLDFGAARHAISEFSKSISVILKPGYAPEEQYRSKGKQGPWTDVYATAATLYRAIVGHVPPESLDRLEEDTIERPSALGVDLPEKAETSLMKALSVKSVDRYQSMEEFQQDLFVNMDVQVDPIVADTSPEGEEIDPIPVEAKKEEAPVDPPQKKAISKWVWIGGGAAVAIFLALGIMGSIFLFGTLAGDEPTIPEGNTPTNGPKGDSGPKVAKQVTVPDVNYIPEKDALAALKKAGLQVGEITYVESIYAKKGYVMEQSLQPKQKAKNKDLINLVVSKGIALPFDEETILRRNIALVNEYWDLGYEAFMQNDLEGALTYYIQASDMASYLYSENNKNYDAQYAWGILERNIAITKRQSSYFEYALVDIENSVVLLEELLKVDPIFQKDPTELAPSYGELSHIQFLNQMYKEAVISAEKSLEFDEKNLIYMANLANAYLFSNQYEEALDIYVAYKDSMVNETQTFKDFVLADFAYFRNIKLTHPDMDKIEELYVNGDPYTDEEAVMATIYANGFALEDEDAAGYMETIDPNSGSYAQAEQDINAIITAYDNITFLVESIEVLEIKGDTATAKVVQTLSYSDGTQNYEAKSTLIHTLVRSDGFYEWLITATKVEGG